LHARFLNIGWQYKGMSMRVICAIIIGMSMQIFSQLSAADTEKILPPLILLPVQTPEELEVYRMHQKRIRQRHTRSRSDGQIYEASQTGRELRLNDNGTEFEPMDFQQWIAARDENGDEDDAESASAPRARSTSLKARVISFLRRSHPEFAEKVRSIID
jgi:hypothetical protein